MIQNLSEDRTPRQQVSPSVHAPCRVHRHFFSERFDLNSTQLHKKNLYSLNNLQRSVHQNQSDGKYCDNRVKHVHMYDYTIISHLNNEKLLE